MGRKKEFLTNALSMSTQQLVDNGIDLNALNGEVEKLEKDISQKSELFGQSFDDKKIKYADVQKAIGKNDVAIEVLRYRYFDHSFTDSIIYVALYVKNDNARPKAIMLPDGSRYGKLDFSLYYRNSIISKMPDQYSYKVFWEPIQKGIGTANVYLSADGVYNLVNLEAIPTPDGRYVIDNANIIMVSNTKDLYLRKVKSKAITASKTATMFGNPTYYMTASIDRNISQLPGTEKEVAELQQLLKEKGWVTDEYVKNRPAKNR